MPPPSNINPDPNSPPYGEFWRCFRRQAGARLWGAVALSAAMGLLEGSGLLLLVPLLRALGFGGGQGGRPFAGFSFSNYLKGDANGTLAGLLAAFVTIKVIQTALRAWSADLNLRLQLGFVSFLRERFHTALTGAGWLFLTRLRSSDLSHTLLGEIPLAGAGTDWALGLLTSAIFAVVSLGV